MRGLPHNATYWWLMHEYRGCSIYLRHGFVVDLIVINSNPLNSPMMLTTKKFISVSVNLMHNPNKQFEGVKLPRSIFIDPVRWIATVLLIS